MSALRILLIHNYYRSYLIGGEDLVFNAELGAIKEAHGDENVFVFTKCNDQIRTLQLALNILFSIPDFFRVYLLVRSKRIKVVHVHNFFPMLSPSIFLAAKLAGAKLVMTLHNYRWWCIAGTFFEDSVGICEHCHSRLFSARAVLKKCYRKSYIESCMASLAFAFYKMTGMVRLVDIFFVLTDFQKNKVIELGLPANKVRLKANFVESAATNSSVVREEKLLFVGRLEKSKGIEVLLDIWRREKIPYRLEIIGAGPLGDALVSEYASANIVFLGKVAHDEVMRRIASAKYLLQPSIWYETFGLTIIEAMSLGVPVIGFDIGTRKELVIDGVNGFIANEQNFYSVLEKAMTSPDYQLLSEGAIEFSKRFQRETIIKNQLNQYTKIATPD